MEKAIMTLDTVSRLKKYVDTIQNTVSKTPLGGPLSLVNSQAVLATGFMKTPEELIDEPPKDLFVPVEYYQGLPTVEGVPIWEKLEFEPLGYYELFKRYRNMQNSSVRRAIYKLHKETGEPPKLLENIRKSYHWNVRVQAFDEYRTAERQRQQEEYRIDLEGKHKVAASKLFGMSMKYLTDHEELMTPKLAMKMLDTAVQLERISVGLAPRSPLYANGAAIQPMVNIQNNLSADGGGSGNIDTSQTTTITDDKEANKERLAQILNIMNNIGALSQEEGEVIDVESKPVT